MGDNNCEYIEQFSVHSVSGFGNVYEIYRTLSGNSEIVAYECYNVATYYEFMSLNPFSVASYGEFVRPDGYSSSGSHSGDSVNRGTYYYASGNVLVPNEYIGDGSSSSLNYNSIYVFDSPDSAYNYLTTGDMSGLVRNKSKKYDSEQIYLDNFRVIYHDSNVLENCYVEVKYTLPEYITDNANEAVLNVDINYNCQAEILSSLVEFDCSEFDINTSVSYDLSLYPCGFDLYLRDISNGSSIQEQMMLGDELYVDFDNISVGDFGANSLGKITKSMIYLDFIPELKGTCGLQNNAQIDLLNPSNTSYYSSTPDSQGNYTSNNDYEQGNGYYTTIVGKDGQGNPTYNYYYYDNSKHYSYEISPDTDVDIDTDIPIGGTTGGGSSGDSVVTILWGNALEVEGSIDLNADFSGSGSGGGSGGSGGDSNVNTGDDIEITIEDDDYTDSALREDLKDGFGLFDDSSTPEKGDGFLSVSASFFNSIDPSASDILMFSLSSVCVISILRSVFRR
ncbi:MAG: hypothetical protein E7257_01675 [Lachnospiraceae bacterium]|nr:hypothetical protein [Lachnospiraceae bacterium]